MRLPRIRIRFMLAWRGPLCNCIILLCTIGCLFCCGIGVVCGFRCWVLISIISWVRYGARVLYCIVSCTFSVWVGRYALVFFSSIAAFVGVLRGLTAGLDTQYEPARGSVSSLAYYASQSVYYVFDPCPLSVSLCYVFAETVSAYECASLCFILLLSCADDVFLRCSLPCD